MLKHCHTIFHTQLNQEKKHASIHKHLKTQICNAYTVWKFQYMTLAGTIN